MSEEKAEKHESKSNPLAWLVVIGIVVAVFLKFGGWQWLTSSSKTPNGQATATLARSGDLCVQGLPAVQSLTCNGCSAPSNFADAVFSCWGGRIAYATDVMPGRAVQISLTGGKSPVNLTFTEFDKPVVLGPAAAATTAASPEPSPVQPSRDAAQDPMRSGGPMGGFTQTASQAAAGNRSIAAPASQARGQTAAGGGYQQVNPPAVQAQPTPEPVQWLPVNVELCQNNRLGRDVCTEVPAQAAGYWYCVAAADLPGYARIDYMKAGNYRYDQLVVQGGFTCGGVRSP